MNMDGNFHPPPMEINRHLIGAVHRAMLLHPSARHTNQYAKILSTLTGLQEQDHQNMTPAGGYGPNTGSVAGGPVQQALAEPSQSDAEGAAGAAALLAQLFPPTNLATQPQGAGLGRLLAGGTAAGLPQAPARFVPSPVVAALGHGAVY